MKHLLKPSVHCFGVISSFWGLSLLMCLFFIPPSGVRGQGSTRSVAKPTIPTGTERRLALVVGNKDYTRPEARLQNPLNDANDMAATLSKLGFEVIKRSNLDRSSLETAIDDFASRLQGYDVGLFYFSGHGMAVQGENYLLPTDANPQNEAQVEYEAVPVGLVMGWMETAQTLTNIVLLDACRDNPYRSLFRSNAAAGGLGKMDAPAGTFIGFAASPGKPSSDGDRSNGLYTEAILAAITKPNRTIDQIFNEVNANVRRRSNGQQVPFKSSSLEADFYFKVENTPTPLPNEVTPPPTTVTPPSEKRVAKFLDLPFAEMVYVEGGTFEMGDTRNEGASDEKPVHSVTVSSFLMGKYEVTQRQWTKIMGSNPSVFKNCDDCPVENVSWNDIQAFLQKLNARTGGSYRLPTEAEWEYAAGGGATNRSRFGNGKNVLDPTEANFDASAFYKKDYSVVGEYRGKPIKVGSFTPNALGIFDLSGNVWEWCSDWKDTYPSTAQTNPRGPASGADRVLRGGSWTSSPGSARVADRSNGTPEFRNCYSGFRLVSQSQ